MAQKEQHNKTRLLICSSRMGVGGVEKALLGLMGSIDYSKYSVDLLLMAQEGEFMEYIDKNVRILPTPSFFSWIVLPKQRIVYSFFKLIARPRILYYFVCNIVRGIIKGNMAMARQKMWKDCIGYIPAHEGEYDIALDFSGLLRQYVLDKVNAGRKYTWIHSDYRVYGLDKQTDGQLLARFDKIFCVSATCKEIFDNEFPFLKNRSEVKHNIIDTAFIMSCIKGKSYDDGFNGTRLLDVTRIDPNKGLDIAVQVCSELKRKGVDFRWYILGNDPLGYKKELIKLIKEYNVEDNFILLGFTSNPYPYMYEADIIVHFSRFEGRSVAIDEALALGKTILLTNYPTAKDQIEDGVNGYICDFDKDALTDKLYSIIKRL